MSKRKKPRHKIKPFAISPETVERMSATELGTKMHQDIERILSGHYHVGDMHGAMNEQLMAYATMLPAADVMLYGGDLIHGCTSTGHEFDLTKAETLIEEFNKALAKAMAPSMNWSTLRDPRRNPVTGRIKPVINDDE